MKLRVLTVLAIGLLVAAEKKGGDAQAELKKVEGGWVPVAIEVDGNQIPKEDLKNAPSKLTLKGDQYTLLMPDKKVQKGTFTIDATKDPKTVDSTPADGPHKGMTIKGIYEVKGDMMKACYDISGKGRPKSFTTKDKPGHVLIVYKRAKAAK